MVFTRRDDYTKNIVDFVYEKLLETGKLSGKVIAASEKTEYWKDALRRYKMRGNYTYSDIAKKCVRSEAHYKRLPSVHG